MIHVIKETQVLVFGIKFSKMDRESYVFQFAREMRNLDLNFTRKNACDFITAMTESMSDGLAKDRELTLSNFGTFFVSKYSSKIIQSPRGDKRKFFMPPTDVVKWKPSLKIRRRAPSQPVTDKEFELLKSRQFRESEEAALLEDSDEELVTKKPNPYEVQINFVSRNRREHFSDDSSPLSRLIKTIINEMKKIGAERIEIRPDREITELVYLAGEEELGKRKLPKISHTIIVEKIKSMAIPDEIANKREKIIAISENEKMRTSTTLTKFGELLIMEKI